MKTALTLLLTLLLLGFSITQAQDAPAISSDGYLRSTRLGINHISGVEEVTSVSVETVAIVNGLPPIA